MAFSRIDLGDMTRLRVSVIRDPVPMLISLLADIYGDRPQGVPEPWRRLVRGSMSTDAAAVLRPMFAPGTPVLPDCISPPIRPNLDSSDPGGHLERIRGADPDVLLAELHGIFGDDVPLPWRPVVAAPERWLRGVADVMADTWGAFAPVWSRASELFDREAERIGGAVVRGAPEAVLLGLGSRHHYQDGSLYIEDRYPEDFALEGRTLAFVPIISSAAPALCELDRPDLVWLGYAMPGQGRLHSAAAPARADAGADALGVAIGAARALILRTLTTPATMSDIAGWIGATAPAATYHCRHLEAAGLLTRRRQGSRTVVRRTARGEALVDLFS
ncbi:DNA-binding transcriptional ArsR family regulator [Catenulispora sp. GAS73]|uniref:winged helix-turn-helix domain-containing protein n=1 Tax=Catenulispora sp. GAS73 TaxID=3156269 RepID=UPI0035134FDC